MGGGGSEEREFGQGLDCLDGGERRMLVTTTALMSCRVMSSKSAAADEGTLKLTEVNRHLL